MGGREEGNTTMRKLVENVGRGEQHGRGEMPQIFLEIPLPLFGGSGGWKRRRRGGGGMINEFSNTGESGFGAVWYQRKGNSVISRVLNSGPTVHNSPLAEIYRLPLGRRGPKNPCRLRLW